MEVIDGAKGAKRVVAQAEVGIVGFMAEIEGKLHGPLVDNLHSMAYFISKLRIRSGWCFEVSSCG